MSGLDVVTSVALIAALPVFVLIVRLIGVRPGDADSLFRSATDLGWPKGVQEEDLVPWRIELLGRRPIDTDLDRPVAPAGSGAPKRNAAGRTA